jgi:repressor LexA
MMEYIEEFITEHGYPPTIREIGQKLGISSTSVVNYNLNKLKNAGLIERDGQVSRGLKLTHPIGNRAIPILGTIAAGEPIPVLEQLAIDELDEEHERIELPTEIVPRIEGIYALHVKGESMIDALINDGDIVVLQQASTASNGDMVAAWITDREETTLKHFFIENGQIRLQPANPTMEPIYVEPGQVEIQGKVIAVIRSLS